VRGTSTAGARELRRRETDAERLLWYCLRDRRLCGIKFRRQHPIGPHFADFASPERRLIVELDGGHHAERAQYDSARTTCLMERGWRVMRFWDDEVLQQPSAVVEAILMALHGAPHPDPLLARGEREPAQGPR
jgi:very-short-patch-repair endonuclease